MINNRLNQFMESVGVLGGPEIVRFYRDGDISSPSIIVQKDLQGIRFMLRAEADPGTWSCAWFDDAGTLIVAEKYCCGCRKLDSGQTEQLLYRLLNEPFKDMARELVPLDQQA